MADSWEDEDWETKEPLNPLTKGAAILASTNEPDKFADEDREEEEVKAAVPKSAAGGSKKKEVKKEQKAASYDDQPLDDPVAEKARLQRLMEEADFKNTQDLFGEVGKKLDSLLPKTVKDYEEYANLVAERYIHTHKNSLNFKHYVKVLFKSALSSDTITSEDVKDIETALALVRFNKAQAEGAAKIAAEKAKKDKGKKATLYLGKATLEAEYEDYIDDAGSNVGDEDDYDFM